MRKISHRIWFRAVTYVLFGVATAFLGLIGGSWIPPGYVTQIGAEAVKDILTILASSMLAVATFSLAIMVTAFGNVSRAATPRATMLIVENQSAQRAISTFIGAFLYSIVAIIALATGSYGESGRFILFLMTIAVIVLIVYTLIRWVDQLSTLGQVADTVSKIEQKSLETLQERAQNPYLGGQPHHLAFHGGYPLTGIDVGSLCLIDIPSLQEICENENIKLRLEVLPGSFIYPERILAYTDRPLAENCKKIFRTKFIIEPNRSFDQDPRFGFILLAEIASRALSTGVNDSGTAIASISSAVKLLVKWKQWKDKYGEYEVRFDRIYVSHIKECDMLEDIFSPIAHDGAACAQVGIKLQKSFAALADLDPDLYGEAARLQSKRALLYSGRSLMVDVDKQLIEKYSIAN